MHNPLVALSTLGAGAALAMLLSAGAAAVGPAPIFELPKPDGPHAIGTTTWRSTDKSRTETFTSSAESREIEVMAWYPATPGRGVRAPYLREGLSEVRTFARLLRAPESAYDDLVEVRTHAELDAAPSGGARLPVLVFSHGYIGIPSSYTALLEGLASRGYAVLSVVHPYEASAATLSGGRSVSMLDETGALLKGIRDVLAEWGPEDSTMAEVTRASDEAEQLRLLRGYLAGLRNTDAALRRWVADTKLALDGLATLARDGPAGRLAARLDMTRVGVFGHSMGGVTAGQFCVEDQRCRAGLNLDGIPQYGEMIDKRFRRPFLMVYSARPGRAGASDAIYRRAASPYYRVDVRDTLHLDFSDIRLWSGPLRDRPIFGAMPPARAADITGAIVREYFDQELLGVRSPILSGATVFPEVTATRTPAFAR
jgi:dienelactone hydrolase